MSKNVNKGAIFDVVWSPCRLILARPVHFPVNTISAGFLIASILHDKPINCRIVHRDNNIEKCTRIEKNEFYLTGQGRDFRYKE